MAKKLHQLMSPSGDLKGFVSQELMAKFFAENTFEPVADTTVNPAQVVWRYVPTGYTALVSVIIDDIYDGFRISPIILPGDIIITKEVAS